jgi:hypothetical protein
MTAITTRLGGLPYVNDPSPTSRPSTPSWWAAHTDVGEGRVGSRSRRTLEQHRADWHGQVAQRQEELADEALAETGGDEAEAERLFKARGGERPEDLPPN